MTNATRRVASRRGHAPVDGHRLEVMPAAGVPRVIWCHTCGVSAGPPPRGLGLRRRLVCMVTRG